MDTPRNHSNEEPTIWFRCSRCVAPKEYTFVSRYYYSGEICIDCHTELAIMNRKAVGQQQTFTDRWGDEMIAVGLFIGMGLIIYGYANF